MSGAAVATGLLALAMQAYAAPSVVKVEPPSWWPGHSINPVRLLLRGSELAGAKVEAEGEGVKAGRAAVSASGNYLFVDLTIDPAAKPGKRTLTLKTAEGAATASFEVLAPLPRTGRFQGFSSEDVMYQLMPDRFANGDESNDDPARSKGLYDRGDGRYYHGGDLQGVIDRLPYLQDLGVTALWLTPWYDNSDKKLTPAGGTPYTDYHGYGAVDYYAVDEHFGDLGTLRHLVDAAHARGIKIVQDQVSNHTGPHHPWTADAPTPTWFNGTMPQHLSNTWDKWALMDPYVTPQVVKATLEGWYFDILPDLNQDDPEVSRYLIQNTLWWIGVSGMDGIRQDTLFFGPRSFWRDWMAAIKKEYPGFSVVGETFDEDAPLVAFFQGGRMGFDGIDTGVDAVFDFPLYYALHKVFLEGKPMTVLGAALSRDVLYPDPSRLVTFIDLHDVERFMSRPNATLERMKLALAFILTTRGLPMLYTGDELALRGGYDPDNRKDFPGGWKGDARDAFADAGRTAEEREVFGQIRTLAKARAASPALRRGRLLTLFVSEKTYAYGRVEEGSAALVVLNNSDKAQRLEFDAAALGLADGELADVLGKGSARVGGGRVSVEAAPMAALVFTGGAR